MNLKSLLLLTAGLAALPLMRPQAATPSDLEPLLQGYVGVLAQEDASLPLPPVLQAPNATATRLPGKNLRLFSDGVSESSFDYVGFRHDASAPKVWEIRSGYARLKSRDGNVGWVFVGEGLRVFSVAEYINEHLSEVLRDEAKKRARSSSDGDAIPQNIWAQLTRKLKSCAPCDSCTFRLDVRAIISKVVHKTLWLELEALNGNICCAEQESAIRALGRFWMPAFQPDNELNVRVSHKGC